MIVYVPAYDAGRHVIPIETADFREMGKYSIARYKRGCGFYGPIYCNTVYLTDAACWDYWHGRPAAVYTLDEIKKMEVAKK